VGEVERYGSEVNLNLSAVKRVLERLKILHRRVLRRFRGTRPVAQDAF
jgi:hypothetical protein